MRPSRRCIVSSSRLLQSSSTPTVVSVRRAAAATNTTAVAGPRSGYGRAFSTSSWTNQQQPPPNRGFPMGNIFNQQPQRKPGEALAEHGTDLTALAKEGKLDPVIGRDDVIKRAIGILSRRTKSNPVLIGKAGTGKTAIVEGLAQRLAAGEVPESIKGKRLVSIDLASIMSGSGIRGSFEEKMRNLIQDIEDEKGSVIPFIDEVHQLLNLGKAEGSLDGANLLKPALARGLQLMGATTLDEYRRTIEKDAALTRRFQSILVDEPDVQQTITMLRGLKPKYELHHGVSISDAAIVAAATYANRYITERHMPDKAIDLMDEAASSLRLMRESKPAELEELERQITSQQIELSSLGKDRDEVSVERRRVLEESLKDLKAQADEQDSKWRADRRRTAEIRATREELEKRRLELEVEQRNGNYQRASELRYAIIPELEKKLPADDANEELAGEMGDRVTSDDVARVVARMTGIPVATLMRSDRSRLLGLESVLKERIVGQDAAVEAVSKAIRLSRAGLSTPNRPIASFLFLGPTGTGKTELSRVLASELTGTAKNLLVLNMSEYSEKHNVSRLIGAPPGYVGYEDGAGELTEHIRRAPNSVVVLDEFEKAARPEVPNLFLQALEGSLTDSHGRKIDTKNVIFIATSNIGSDILMRPESMRDDGSVTEEAKQEVLKRVQELYPPELLNRLDDQIVFNSLGPDVVSDIVTLRLKELEQSLQETERRIHLTVEGGARDWLAKESYSKQWGARLVNRVISKHVREPLSLALLQGTIRTGDVARIRLNRAGNGLEVVPVHEPEVEAPSS